ncbi:MAG: glycosyltransferase family 4 protein [Thermoanaerobaculia bacterium]
MSYRIGIDARKIADFGIGTYIQHLVRALAEIDRENRYFLFVGRRYEGELDDLPENFRRVTERAAVYSLREQVVLSWRLARLSLDLYHATHYVLPLLTPRRVVVTIHDIIHLLYPEFLPHRLAFLYAQGMIRRSLGRADLVIADSQNTKTDLMEYFEVDGRKVRRIYPGVADEFRQPLAAEDLQRWRDRFGLLRPYLLFVGNPTKPHKNLDNVVQAYAQAVERHGFDADLVCVGGRDGADAKVQQRAAQLGLGERVKLLGHVEQRALPALYQGATLFLYPTLYEGFGLPVVEAMASGVAVITSHNSALREIAEGYAELVDPLDVDAIGGAIVRCLTDADHRRGLAEQGRRRARDFDWRRTAEQTLEVYRSVLAASPADGGSA